MGKHPARPRMHDGAGCPHAPYLLAPAQKRSLDTARPAVINGNSADSRLRESATRAAIAWASSEEADLFGQQLHSARGAAQAEALARVLRALDGGSQLAMSINHRIPAVRFHVRQAVKQMEIDDMAIINQCPKDTANASLRYTALEQIEQLSIPDSQRVRVAAQLGTLLGAASNRFRN